MASNDTCTNESQNDPLSGLQTTTFDWGPRQDTMSTEQNVQYVHGVISSQGNGKAELSRNIEAGLAPAGS